MGMFDFIFGGPEKQVLRQCKRVSNKNAQPEDREAAAFWLAENGGEQAILGLLGRFEITIENQMKDLGEKQVVFDLLEEIGQPVLEPTTTFVKVCKSIAKPLRLLQEVGGSTVLLKVIYEMLDVEAAKDDFKPLKKRQLLIKLAELKDNGKIASASRFLQDFDEGVRYAASECMLSQESDTAHGPLLAVLADPEDDSNRLKIRLAEVFHQRRWDLGEVSEMIAPNPPTGWKVQGNRLVKA